MAGYLLDSDVYKLVKSGKPVTKEDVDKLARVNHVCKMYDSAFESDELEFYVFSEDKRSKVEEYLVRKGKEQYCAKIDRIKAEADSIMLEYNGLLALKKIEKYKGIPNKESAIESRMKRLDEKLKIANDKQIALEQKLADSGYDYAKFSGYEIRNIEVVHDIEDDRDIRCLMY